ncbi:twin-arginine translocase TatA/TatE family subunit [Georgenia sp. Z1491]|uniref:twin-arginine translocase TatA/TatE family subunit n=1 Tax=Georgenia sp. Z1491 TaxID=3416707 RepID=UPI003CF2FD25
MTGGLSLEKLVVVLVVASLVIGPSRLPGYAARLGEVVRGLRDAVEATRTRTENELGVPLSVDEWRDAVRRYDPRRVVREALAEEPVGGVGTEEVDGRAGTAGTGVPVDPAGTDAPVDPAGAGVPVEAADLLEVAESSEPAHRDAPSEPAWRWQVAGGSSGHPRRVRVPVAASADSPPADASSAVAPPGDASSAVARRPDASPAGGDTTAEPSPPPDREVRAAPELQ